MKNLSENGKKIKNYFSKSIIKSKPSDREFDEMRDQSLEELLPVALNKLSITKQDCIKESVAIWGPPNFKNLAGMKFEIKKGKDDYLRFIPLGVTIYNFTQHSLLAYQCDFDPTTSNALNENTFEYFYNDIVSFHTASISKSETEYDWKDKIVKYIPVVGSLMDTGKIIQKDTAQKFVLTTSGGTSLSVTLTEDILKEVTDGGKFLLSDALRSINTIRRIIRDKKSYTIKS